jgi:hypothetical protein
MKLVLLQAEEMNDVASKSGFSRVSSMSLKGLSMPLSPGSENNESYFDITTTLNIP